MNENKNSTIIEFKNVSKKYKDLLALDNLSFKIKKGDIFGYIGPNGAGKTTTIKILVGLINHHSGEVFIKNQSIKNSENDLTKILGYLPQETGFQEWRTVYHILQTFGRLSGMEKKELEKTIPEVLHTVGLIDIENKKITHLSGGMKQKLRFAQAILNDPEILILDEPLSGLDPSSRFQIKKIIKNLAEREITILFSSHILTDVQDFANRIGILNHGKLLRIGTPGQLQQEFDIENIIKIEYSKKIPSSKIFQNLQFINSVEKKARNIHLILLNTDKDIDDAIHKILQEIINNNIKLRNFNLLKPSLEEVYLRVIEEIK